MDQTACGGLCRSEGVWSSRQANRQLRKEVCVSRVAVLEHVYPMVCGRRRVWGQTTTYRQHGGQTAAGNCVHKIDVGKHVDQGVCGDQTAVVRHAGRRTAVEKFVGV